MYEGFTLFKAIHSHHNIRKNARDIIVFTRPDVFTNAFDANKLYKVHNTNYMLYICHRSKNCGVGNDPNEAWILSTWQSWEKVMNLYQPGGIWLSCKNKPLERLMGFPAYLNISLFYVHPNFGVSLTRNNKKVTCLHTCPASMKIDLTQQLTCTIPRHECFKKPSTAIPKKSMVSSFVCTEYQNIL